MRSVFEPVDEVRRGGRSRQSLRGSKGLFKDISSLKVVMDGSVRPGSPHWLCVCACVCVRVHLHVSGEDGTKMLGSPPPPSLRSPPMSVLYPPDSLMSNLPSLLVPRGCRIYLTCPASKRRCVPRSAREGHG